MGTVRIDIESESLIIKIIQRYNKKGIIDIKEYRKSKIIKRALENYLKSL